MIVKLLIQIENVKNLAAFKNNLIKDVRIYIKLEKLNRQIVTTIISNLINVLIEIVLNINTETYLLSLKKVYLVNITVRDIMLILHMRIPWILQKLTKCTKTSTMILIPGQLN